MEKSKEKITMKVSRNTIIGNVVLSVFKLAAGIIGNSAAMLSDAVHSLSDVLSTVIVMIGVKLSNQKADKQHPYGHERFECVVAIVLAIILGATGLGIGYGGIRTIAAGSYDQIAIPGIIALAASIVSIVVKEVMYWYTIAAAKQTDSGALKADAWHHRSDAFSSVGSLAGIAGARLGFPVLDSVACIVICIFIFKVAFDIFVDAIGRMTDRACDEQMIEQLQTVVQQQEEVFAIDEMKTRLFGDRVYVDLEISVDGSMPLSSSHEIAHQVHDAVEMQFPQIKHCMIHVNPVVKN